MGPAPPRGYAWFAASIASWFGAWGLQAVLFSWLVVGELRASPEWVGICQTATLVPALILLLFGGAAADRWDPRRLLVLLHAGAVVPVLALATSVVTGTLSLSGLILYGASIGTISALTMPARDTLLSAVAGRDMMRAVTGMTAVQFGAQAAGNLLAGAARFAGSAPMLFAQAAVLLVGSFTASRIPGAAPARARAARRSTLREIGDGIAEVLHTPRLRSPVGLVFAVGLLFIGPFMVVFPLLVRDFYGGEVGELSLVFMMFPLGTIAGSLTLRARGGLARKGRALLLALTGAALTMSFIGLGPAFPWMVGATLVWGLFGSVFINASRTLVQEAAPAEHRARVLSVYQLGFMGAAPLGSLGAGFAAARVGPPEALLFFAAAMLGVVALAAAFTETSRMD